MEWQRKDAASCSLYLYYLFNFQGLSNCKQDLWGRGYSDSCADLPHDERLYTTQILLAISSSSLAWTSGFTLVGYSLGGGIAVAFASSFPNLVDSLALVAPVGLVREERVAAGRRIFALIALLPISILERFIKKRLQTPLFPQKDKEAALAAEKGEKRYVMLGNRGMILF